MLASEFAKREFSFVKLIGIPIRGNLRIFDYYVTPRLPIRLDIRFLDIEGKRAVFLALECFRAYVVFD